MSHSESIFYLQSINSNLQRYSQEIPFFTSQSNENDDLITEYQNKNPNELVNSKHYSSIYLELLEHIVSNKSFKMFHIFFRGKKGTGKSTMSLNMMNYFFKENDFKSKIGNY